MDSGCPRSFPPWSRNPQGVLKESRYSRTCSWEPLILSFLPVTTYAILRQPNGKQREAQGRFQDCTVCRQSIFDKNPFPHPPIHPPNSSISKYPSLPQAGIGLKTRLAHLHCDSRLLLRFGGGRAGWKVKCNWSKVFHASSSTAAGNCHFSQESAITRGRLLKMRFSCNSFRWNPLPSPSEKRHLLIVRERTEIFFHR